MTNKYALITLLLFLTLFTARGQSNVEVSLKSNPYGYTIDKKSVDGTSGTFVIKGTYENTNPPTALERAVIVIKEDVDRDITLLLENVTIDVSTLTVTGGTAYCPIDASDFKHKLTLRLKEESLLKAGHNRPAIAVPSVDNLTDSLVIEDYGDGDGILNAIGGANCAAIGSGYYLDSSPSKYFGNITIRSGTINARGGNLAAAIGSSYYTSGGTVTIEGGHVTATGDSAHFETTGIGNGGHNVSGNFITGGTVRITGGVVEAWGTHGYPGIGTGTNCLGGTVEISGGTVTAMGSDEGLKNMGIDGTDLTFNATGNAFILTDGIQPQENKTRWKGVIFENNEGSVYTGEHQSQSQSLEITTDATIPDTVTLTIPEGTTLTIPKNVELQNDGTIHNNGTINGSIKGKAIQHSVMFYSNYKGASPEYTITYVTTGDLAPVSSETRTLEKHTFVGWFNQSDGGTEVTKLTVWAPAKLYARWNKNEIKTVTKKPSLTGAYGNQLEFDLAQFIASDSYTNGLTYEFADPDAERYGLEIQGQRLAGRANKLTADGTISVDLTIKISSEDCEGAVSKDMNLGISRRPLNIISLPDQLIYRGEGPLFTVKNKLDDEEPAFSGQLGLDLAKDTITLGTLALKDNGAFLADNYMLYQFKTGSYTYIDQLPSDIESQPTGTKHGDWYTGPVTFAAPEGFTIKLKEATPATGTTTTKAVEAPTAMGINTKALSDELRASGEDFASSFTFGQEGMYDVSYLLRRDAPYNQEYGHTQQSVFVDLNAPVVNVSTSYQSYTLTATDGKGSGIASVLIDNSPMQLNAAGSYDGYGSEGTHSYKVTDNVGHTTEGSFSLYARETYTVVIPETEGATLTPAPGTYYFDEGDFFLLYLELDSAYSQSTPVVKANDRVIDPNRDGSYTISVYSDIVLSIGGIPVSIDRVSDGKSRVYASAGILHIETATPQRMLISTMGGKLIRYSSLPAGSNRVYGLPDGVYIVKLSDGTTMKVGINRR